MIFVDSSHWIALRNQRDRWAATAQQIHRSVASEQLVTTNHIRGETWTFLHRKAGHHAAVGFLDLIERSPRLQIVHVDQDTERRALEWLRRHDEREYSFVDATSFAVMRSMKIRKALAFDGDFTAAGFVELRPT
ncbi:MAG TPA: PIN domain-containing protein [Actinomycetota bacterium]|nr:PIN domain-containing protein [Actinomycetota bacterium]